MNKLFLVLSVMAIGLSGCYGSPYRDHNDAYGGNHDHQDHRQGGDQQQDRDSQQDGHGGYQGGHDGYHHDGYR